jgi:hypothetical protein
MRHLMVRSNVGRGSQLRGQGVWGRARRHEAVRAAGKKQPRGQLARSHVSGAAGDVQLQRESLSVTGLGAGAEGSW